MQVKKRKEKRKKKVYVFVVVFDHPVEYSFNASKTHLVHSWFFWCSLIPQTSDTDGLQDLSRAYLIFLYSYTHLTRKTFSQIYRL